MNRITSRIWRGAGSRRPIWTILSLFLVGGLATTGANALDKDDIAIHGFGGWAYGVTDGNRYLVGDEDGKFDNVQFSLNLTAQTHERFTIVTQLKFEEQEDDLETELDYAFVEIKLNKTLNLRLGRVKHPYGIYAEIFDVGTLRPFFLLPQSIYGAQGITSQHYDGAGLRGSQHGEAWGVEWDVYAGEFEGQLELPGPLTGDPSQIFESIAVSEFQIEDVIGGRLNVFTPLDGLTFGFSAYDGSQRLQSLGGQESSASYSVYGAHVEYLTDRWSIRSEISKIEVASGDSFEGDGFYFEAAYRFSDHWQVAARYDDFDATIGPLAPIDLSQLPPFAAQFTESQDIGLGLNYWLSPTLVLRLNLHLVEGNRFAFPDDMAEIQQVFLTNRLEDETQLLIFGAQFSF